LKKQHAEEQNNLESSYSKRVIQVESIQDDLRNELRIAQETITKQLEHTALTEKSHAKQLYDLESSLSTAIKEKDDTITNLEYEIGQKQDVINEIMEERQHLIEDKSQFEEENENAIIQLGLYHRELIDMKAEKENQYTKMIHLQGEKENQSIQIDKLMGELSDLNDRLERETNDHVKENQKNVENIQKSIETKNKNEVMKMRMEHDLLKSQLQNSEESLKFKEEEALALKKQLEEERVSRYKSLDDITQKVLGKVSREEAESVEFMRKQLISLATSLEISERKREEASEKIMKDARSYGESLKKLRDSAIRYYNTAHVV